MINLTKKQVGALLKVMSNDTSRPILNGVHIDEYKGKHVMVATNGYILTALELDVENPLDFKMGTFVRRSALEKWYKLATGKNRLTTEELVKVSAEDYADNNGYQQGQYPDWKNILPDEKGIETLELTFNADYMKTMQDLADKPLTYRFNGKLGALVAKNNNDLYVIMPLRG